MAKGGYRGSSLRMLESFGVSVGDEVLVRTAQGSFEGTVMPRYEFADEEYIVFKLKTGYNAGIRVDRIASIDVLARGSEPTFRAPPRPKLVSGLPRILIVGTGGTIASRVDYRTGGVKPALTSEELYYLVPELSSMAEIETDAIFNIYSENMTPLHWSRLAERLGRAVEEGYDGMVVTHGTDTLHYTSAAMTFALRDLPVPVVLVGSQRSSDRPSSDAATNLIGAVTVAGTSPFSGVFVVMHSGLGDDELSVHLGVRVRKNHSSRRDAFESVGIDPVGRIRRGVLEMDGTGLPSRRKGTGGFVCRPEFSDKVALLKVHPSFEPALLDVLVQRGYRAVIIEGTGLGHVPSSLYPSIRAAVEKGVFIGMTTQTIWGSVRMTVYDTGRDLLSMGVVPLGDMLPEVALAKASWLAGQATPPDKFGTLMATDMAGEMLRRRAVRRR